jgi:predicted dehydrogenase
MAQDPIRIAVIGAGLIGRRHVDHVRACPEAALHSIIDPTDAARDLAAACGVPWFAEIGAMLAAGKPDAAIVATPNSLHVEHGLAAIAAGLPTLVEKPIADSVEGARRLVEAAAAADVPLLVGHHRRHNPLIARAKETLDSGRLGRIVAAHAFFWIFKPDPYFDVAWRRQPGGGPVLINLIHDIDLLRHLVGEIDAVQALQSNAVRGHPVDETTVLTFRFANGALGTANISDTIVSPWNWEHNASENREFPRTDQNFLFIGGTHGSLSLPRLDVWTNEKERSWLKPFAAARIAAHEENPLDRQILQLCRVVRGEEPPLVPGLDGLRTLEVVDAVRRAAASGRTELVRP